jgi:hypothetical protein
LDADFFNSLLFNFSLSSLSSLKKGRGTLKRDEGRISVTFHFQLSSLFTFYFILFTFHSLHSSLLKGTRDAKRDEPARRSEEEAGDGPSMNQLLALFTLSLSLFTLHSSLFTFHYRRGGGTQKGTRDGPSMNLLFTFHSFHSSLFTLHS